MTSQLWVVVAKFDRDTILSESLFYGTAVACGEFVDEQTGAVAGAHIVTATKAADWVEYGVRVGG